MHQIIQNYLKPLRSGVLKMKFREKELDSGVKIFLGKDAKNNDELVKKYKGKKNIILHTLAPGSPFCVIDSEKPSKKDLTLSGAYCAAYSQDWRDNKTDIKVHVFTGKDVSKPLFGKKIGTWKVKKAKTMTIKKQDIEKCQK